MITTERAIIGASPEVIDAIRTLLYHESTVGNKVRRDRDVRIRTHGVSSANSESRRDIV